MSDLAIVYLALLLGFVLGGAAGELANLSDLYRRRR